jgi:hypothetical protein
MDSTILVSDVKLQKTLIGQNNGIKRTGKNVESILIDGGRKTRNGKKSIKGYGMPRIEKIQFGEQRDGKKKIQRKEESRKQKHIKL